METSVRKIEVGNLEVKRNGDHTEKSQHTSNTDSRRRENKE